MSSVRKTKQQQPAGAARQTRFAAAVARSKIAATVKLAAKRGTGADGERPVVAKLREELYLLRSERIAERHRTNKLREELSLLRSESVAERRRTKYYADNIADALWHAGQPMARWEDTTEIGDIALECGIDEEGHYKDLGKDGEGENELEFMWRHYARVSRALKALGSSLDVHDYPELVKWGAPSDVQERMIKEQKEKERAAK